MTFTLNSVVYVTSRHGYFTAISEVSHFIERHSHHLHPPALHAFPGGILGYMLLPELNLRAFFFNLSASSLHSLKTYDMPDSVISQVNRSRAYPLGAHRLKGKIDFIFFKYVFHWMLDFQTSQRPMSATASQGFLACSSSFNYKENLLHFAGTCHGFCFLSSLISLQYFLAF